MELHLQESRCAWAGCVAEGLAIFNCIRFGDNEGKTASVGIDLRAIRNRFETEIRLEVVAACPYPLSEASCEAGAMRGEVTPYRRGHGVPGGQAISSIQLIIGLG